MLRWRSHSLSAHLQTRPRFFSAAQSLFPSRSCRASRAGRRRMRRCRSPLPARGAACPNIPVPLPACIPDVVPNRAFYRMQPTSILCARVHSDANSRVCRPHPPRRAKRCRKTPQFARAHPTAIFSPSLPSPAGTAQRASASPAKQPAARPPQNNRRRPPSKRRRQSPHTKRALPSAGPSFFGWEGKSKTPATFCFFPRAPRRAERRRKPPQFARAHPTAIFNPSLPSPAGTAQRAARPPRSNRQHVPAKQPAAASPIETPPPTAAHRMRSAERWPIPFGMGRKI